MRFSMTEKALSSMPAFEAPQMKELKLGIKFADLPSDWKRALAEEKSVDDSFIADLVKLCPKCGLNLLSGDEETVWECSECQGLYHRQCRHGQRCPIV